MFVSSASVLRRWDPGMDKVKPRENSNSTGEPAHAPLQPAMLTMGAIVMALYCTDYNYHQFYFDSLLHKSKQAYLYF